MSGRTGYTNPTNDSPFAPPADITGVYEHFDSLIGESAATLTDLPDAGTRPVGYHVWVVAEGCDYVDTGSAWMRNGSSLLGLVVATPNQLLTTTKVAISGLSSTVTVPALPVRVKSVIQFENSASGGDRTVAAELRDGGTVLGLTRNFVIPWVTGSTVQSCVLIATYTPSAGSHVYTVQANASINSAITVRECEIEVTVLR